MQNQRSQGKVSSMWQLNEEVRRSGQGLSRDDLYMAAKYAAQEAQKPQIKVVA